MQVGVGIGPGAAAEDDPPLGTEPALVCGDPGPFYDFGPRLPQDVTVVLPQGARPDLVVGRHRPQHRSVSRSLATRPPANPHADPGRPPCSWVQWPAHGKQCVSAHERMGTVSRSTVATTAPVSARSSSTMSAPASRSSPAAERPLATPIDRAPPIPAASTSRVESAMYTVVCSVKSPRYFSAASPRAFSSIAPLGYTSEPKPPTSM